MKQPDDPLDLRKAWLGYLARCQRLLDAQTAFPGADHSDLADEVRLLRTVFSTLVMHHADLTGLQFQVDRIDRPDRPTRAVGSSADVLGNDFEEVVRTRVSEKRR